MKKKSVDDIIKEYHSKWMEFEFEFVNKQNFFEYKKDTYLFLAPNNTIPNNHIKDEILNNSKIRNHFKHLQPIGNNILFHNYEKEISFPLSLYDTENQYSSDTLNFITNFDITEYDKMILIFFIISMLKNGHCYILRWNGLNELKKYVNIEWVFELHTDANEYNEHVILALKQNKSFFWSKHWCMSIVGGHYYFNLG